MNWQFQRTEVGSNGQKFRYLDQGGSLLLFKDVIELWAQDDLFCGFHCQVLSDIPFKAYKWETPVVDVARIERPFEFVVLNAPRLDRAQDMTAFQERFGDTPEDQLTIAFPNLGKNAILVVPTPSGQEVNHCHLGAFIRTCQAEHESSLWRQVGISMQERVSNKPVWLSTAGGGVAWLHIRLDDRPKYYGYRDYKSP